MVPNYKEVLLKWMDFYYEQFSFIDRSIESPLPPAPGLVGRSIESPLPPEHRDGFDRLVVVSQGVTAEKVFQRCNKHFPTRKFERTSLTLDEMVRINDRNALHGTYAIWVRNRVEADDELQNKSASYLTKANVRTITLLERLILELDYYLETGRHLDTQSFTLCAGSRCPLGSVPFVSWNGGKLEVIWYDDSIADGSIRAREVIERRRIIIA